MQTDRLFDLIRKATHEKKLVWEKDGGAYEAYLRDEHSQQYNLTLVTDNAWSIKLWVTRGNYIGWEKRISHWRKSPEEKMFLQGVYESAADSARLRQQNQERLAECFAGEVADTITSLLEFK